MDRQALQGLGTEGDGQLQWTRAEEAERYLQKESQGQATSGGGAVDCGYNDERGCRGSLDRSGGVGKLLGVASYYIDLTILLSYFNVAPRLSVFCIYQRIAD